MGDMILGLAISLTAGYLLPKIEKELQSSNAAQIKTQQQKALIIS